jgi:D-hexose-6-phosphate mutarotase
VQKTFTQPLSDTLAMHGSLPRLVIDHPRCKGEIFVSGAHVTEWQPAGHEPVLFLSPKSLFAPGTPIRGGVPICFPWFGPHSSGHTDMPAHGFARTLPWVPMNHSSDEQGVRVHMQLASQPPQGERSGNEFVVDYHLLFGDVLEMKMIVTNTGQNPFDFESALHTYFRVSDVRHITIAGLKETQYVSKSEGMVRKTQADELIRLEGETDRVYLNTTSTCTIDDPGMSRRIIVEKIGSQSTVIWNPSERRASELKDLGSENWTGFVCIETANVAENLIKLAPGAKHELAQLVRVEKT